MGMNSMLCGLERVERLGFVELVQELATASPNVA